MGKRNFRKNKGGDSKKFGNRGSNQGGRDSWSETVKENEKWEKYYKAMNIYLIDN